MSIRWVALLRGVNVGKANRVPMAELRRLATDLGFGEVATLLNSGNLVFSSGKTDGARAAGRLEEALNTRLGVSTTVMVVSAEELAEIIAANPLVDVATDPSRLLVGVVATAEDLASLMPIARQDWGNERLALQKRAPGPAAPRGGRHESPQGSPRAFYLWVPDGVIASRLNAAVVRALGTKVTARNWGTMLKLLELARAP